MQFEDPACVLDALSQRVLQHLPVSTWRKLFLRPPNETMRFTAVKGAVLCAAAPVNHWNAAPGARSELEFLARVHGGELDPCPQALALVSFADAHAALAMAVELQQVAPDMRYQVGVASGDCTLAMLQLEDAVLPLLLGTAVDEAELVTRQATPGSIRLAASAYGELQEAIERISNCMVAAEYEGEKFVAASLTPAPRSNAFLSTFAGLGMT